MFDENLCSAAQTFVLLFTPFQSSWNSFRNFYFYGYLPTVLKKLHTAQADNIPVETDIIE
jgi:hypothetical protein